MDFTAREQIGVNHSKVHVLIHRGVLQSDCVFPQEMTMMFEVQDLAVASPATVSRCGMVYLEPGILGLRPFVECWLKALPDPIYNYEGKLFELFRVFLEVRFPSLI